MYSPLVAHGARLGNLLAFLRGDNVLAAVPRFTHSIGAGWGDTSLPLPDGTWTNAFTGASHREAATPAALFKEFPVALLLKDRVAR